MDAIREKLLENLKEKITSVVDEVMEMTFIDAEPMKEGQTESVDWLNMKALYADILIQYPFPAEVRLIMPYDLVTKMAKNIYVTKEIADVSILEDLIGETLNMIAGRLMASLLIPEEKFRLSVPELGEDSFLDTDAFSFAMDFDAEGFPFWVVACGEGFVDPQGIDLFKIDSK